MLAAWKALPGTADRAPAHRGVGRAGGGHGDHVPHRVSPPREPEGIDGPRPDHRHVGKRRRTRSRPIDCRPVWPQWGKLQLTLPYLVFLGARSDRAGSACGSCPRRARRRHEPTTRTADRSARSARLPVPAAAATLAAFSANGLFAGLSGLFLATTLHRPSHALSGATLFLVFSCGVVSQLVTAKLQASRVLALGTVSMLVGSRPARRFRAPFDPNLALFLIGGALIGAGAGAVFKGTTGIVLEASAPENRLAMTSDLLIALFVGLSVPVIGAGIALNQGASAPNTVLGFAILVGLGVSVSGWALLGRRPRSSEQAA